METPTIAPRKIIHLDMDCFYAAVEMRERPELAGLPLAVGGGGRRGVICTCNYAARARGVRSAMPGFRARELCPELVFLPVRFDLYRTESEKIRRILCEYSELVEPLSLDEAYVDVTAAQRYAWDLAREIRARILGTTGLTASAGVAPNKMLAKIASDWRKPDGQFAITPEMIPSFMRELPAGRIPGVGPKAVAKLACIGIHTCGQLQGLTSVELAARFGKWGAELYHLCRGRDDRPVEPGRPRKSMSNESTFAENIAGLDACWHALLPLLEELLRDIRGKEPERRIVTCFLKVKFADFSERLRSVVTAEFDRAIFFELLQKALGDHPLPVRLLGAGVRFEPAGNLRASQSEFPFVENKIESTGPAN